MSVLTLRGVGFARAGLKGAGLLALVLSLWACSSAPKPAELVEFEALRKSNYNQQILKDEEALPYLKASDEFYALAIEFHDDGDLEETKHYSLLGSMKHRTADAITRKKDADGRLTIANDKYLRFQKHRNEHDTKRELTEKNISSLEREKQLLEDKIAGIQRDETRDAEQKRKDQLAVLKNDAEATIGKAEVAQKEAEKYGAQKHAVGLYSQGLNKLASAKKFLGLEKFEQASEFALGAEQDFLKSKTEAEPTWKVEQEKLRMFDLNKAIQEEATRLFPPGSVRVEGRGLVIVVDSLFKAGQTKLDAAQLGALENVMSLARKYGDYKVLVEGHTDKGGNASKNLSLSQTRADTVRNLFVERGIDVNRLLTIAKGGDAPAFTNKRDGKRNHRVDVIFLFPQN
jgi:outer membrane protein OmpA-like peptidoglycan-associated protein